MTLSKPFLVKYPSTGTSPLEKDRTLWRRARKIGIFLGPRGRSLSSSSKKEIGVNGLGYESKSVPGIRKKVEPEQIKTLTGVNLFSTRTRRRKLSERTRVQRHQRSFWLKNRFGKNFWTPPRGLLFKGGGKLSLRRENKGTGRVFVISENWGRKIFKQGSGKFLVKDSPEGKSLQSFQDFFFDWNFFPQEKNRNDQIFFEKGSFG